MSKPHKGTINSWTKYPCKSGIGYYIFGRSEGHPEFHGAPIRTSYVVNQEGNEIETNNSRYTLGVEHGGTMPNEATA